MTLGRVTGEVMGHYGQKLRDAAGNNLLSKPEQSTVTSTLLQDELQQFRGERPGKTVRIDNVAGSFTGRLEVVVGDLLEPAASAGSPVRITKTSANKIENAEVRSLVKQILSRGEGGPGLDKLASALSAALTSAEDEFDPIADGQHFLGQKLDVRSFTDARKVVRQPVIDHDEVFDSMEILARGQEAIVMFADTLGKLAEDTFTDAEEQEAIGGIRSALLDNTTDNVADARLVSLSSTGPIYGRATEALIIKGKDGSFYLLQSESVG
jgi:hypothetical protein